MQKRANSARRSLKARFAGFLARLVLLGSLAGGIPVGSTLTWYVEATAKAETLIVWHGPKGTAAEFSTASDG